MAANGSFGVDGGGRSLWLPFYRPDSRGLTERGSRMVVGKVHHLWLVLVLASVFGGAGVASAQGEATGDEAEMEEVPVDEILLKDGSRLIGEIKGMGDGVLEIATGSAGTLKVKFEDIETLNSSGTHTVVLRDGSRQVGRPTVGPGGNVQIQTELSGVVPVQLGDITAINPPPPPGVTHKGFMGLSGRITDGNTRTKSARAEAEYEARGDRHRLTIRGDWNYEESQAGLTARNARGAIKYDFFVTEKLFTYVNASFEGDDFADLNLRTTLGAGLGYQFLDDKTFQYYEEAGISFFDEDFDLGRDDRYAAGRVAGKFDWNIVQDRVVFFHRHEFFLGFEDEEDVYVDTQTGTRLTIIDNFYANFQINWSWDNTPAPGIRRTDTEYLWGLGYSFSL